MRLEISLFKKVTKRRENRQGLTDFVPSPLREAVGLLPVTPSVTVSQISLRGGETIAVDDASLTVVVGPNNAGKSQLLREIIATLKSGRQTNLITQDIAFSLTGTAQDAIRLLSQSALPNERGSSYNLRGEYIYKTEFIEGWSKRPKLGEGFAIFANLLTGEKRLELSNPPKNVALLGSEVEHPFHVLMRSESLLLRTNGYMMRAFGQELIPNFSAGQTIPIHVGHSPKISDRLSIEYVREVSAMPLLQSQGDGMRSFAGLMMEIIASKANILLIDEPEAFLHPPQARLLGRAIANLTAENRQCFIATHSSDMLQGVLDSTRRNVGIIRLKRSGDVTTGGLLHSDDVSRLWSDPLLRHSNILDGLFHDGVVVCESDSDTRFYSAVRDAIFGDPSEHAKSPDLMFVHCGGKARIDSVVRGLRAVNVPVAVITDFDALNNSEPLGKIVRALDEDEKEFERLRRLVDEGIRSRDKTKTTAQIKEEISQVLLTVEGAQFPEVAARKITEALKPGKAWSSAKQSGRSYVPSGQASQACDDLLTKLAQVGVFVVPVGELESFVRTAPNHGPAWVNDVLQRDVRTDPELDKARRFVEGVVNYFG